MIKIGKVAVTVALFAAISLPVPACRSSAKPILNVFAWAGLFKPALIARFEQEAGCRSRDHDGRIQRDRLGGPQQ